jgi:hypothetical protein
MKLQSRLNPADVFLGCSTTKKSYENLFKPEHLAEIPEYRHICEQMENLKSKYPKIQVCLNDKSV